MNDLPVSDTKNNRKAQDSDSQKSVQTTPTVGLGMKETEPAGGIPEGLRDATGGEYELPKEVSSSGVTVRPARIRIPPKVAKMGVRPSGHNVPTQTTPTVALPLTDDQIAQGLQKSFVDSWRWLSEWCVKKLKELHISIKSIHGKAVRVKI